MGSIRIFRSTFQNAAPGGSQVLRPAPHGISQLDQAWPKGHVRQGPIKGEKKKYAFHFASTNFSLILQVAFADDKSFFPHLKGPTLFGPRQTPRPVAFFPQSAASQQPVRKRMALLSHSQALGASGPWQGRAVNEQSPRRSLLSLPSEGGVPREVQGVLRCRCGFPQAVHGFLR